MARERDLDLDVDVQAALDRGAPDEAAAMVVRRLGPDLLGYLVSVLGDEPEGREVFAAVAEQVLISIARFRGESAVKTWAYRIAWRTAMKHREAPERRRMERLATGDESKLAAEVRASTALYQRTATKDWLARARAELTDDEQSLLVLRVDRELAWNEIATIMGEADDAAEAARLRKRFERLKERLRELAVRDGVIDD